MNSEVEITEAESPFLSVARIFQAIANFFMDPAVQQAGAKLFRELELDDPLSPGLSTGGDKRPELVRPLCDDPDCNKWPHYKDDPQCVNFDPERVRLERSGSYGR